MSIPVILTCCNQKNRKPQTPHVNGVTSGGQKQNQNQTEIEIEMDPFLPKGVGDDKLKDDHTRIKEELRKELMTQHENEIANVKYDPKRNYENQLEDQKTQLENEFANVKDELIQKYEEQLEEQ